MKLEDLKMGDMFYCKNRDAWVVVIQSNSPGNKNYLLIIDSAYAFYLDPERDKGATSEWLKDIQPLHKFRIGDAYAKFIRDIEK